MPASYTIEPIHDREAVQKNFITLPSKADSYSDRRVSLNERFSIIERGYFLQPAPAAQDESKEKSAIPKYTVKAMPIVDQSPLADFLEKIKEKAAKRKEAEKIAAAKDQQSPRSSSSASNPNSLSP